MSFELGDEVKVPMVFIQRWTTRGFVTVKEYIMHTHEKIEFAVETGEVVDKKLVMKVLRKTLPKSLRRYVTKFKENYNKEVMKNE